MAFAVKITIGGLCMFVLERNGSGTSVALHVLMPKMRHSGMVHLPLAICEPDVVVGATDREVIPVDRRVIDLSGVVNGGGSPPPPLATVPKEFVRVTKFADTPLKARWMRVTEAEIRRDPTIPVATRIVFDARVGLTKTGHPAKMDVTHPHAPMGETLEMAGRGIVTINDVDDTLLEKIADQLQVPLQIPASRVLELQLVNIMPHDLDFTKPEKVKKGKPAEHFDVYYDLLDPVPPKNLTKRPIPKAHADDEVKPDKKGFFIQPYRCTAVSGCNEGDPGFPDC